MALASPKHRVSAEFIDARLIHVRKTTRIAAVCIADANPFALRVGKIGSLSHGEERRRHREKSDDYGPARGNITLISVNWPGSVSTSIEPPCCLTMMS